MNPATLLPMDWLLVAVVLVCGVTDIFWNKIYNPVTLAAIVAAVVVSVIGQGANTLSGPKVDLLECLAGLALGFLPFFALYVVGGLGGGDVKLMTAIGAIKGAGFVAYTMLYALFLGAFIGVVVTWWRGELLPILKRVGYTILHTLTPTVGPVSYLDVKGPKVNFGFAICLGTLLCLAGQLLGRQLLDF